MCHNSPVHPTLQILGARRRRAASDSVLDAQQVVKYLWSQLEVVDHDTPGLEELLRAVRPNEYWAHASEPSLDALFAEFVVRHKLAICIN